MKTSTQAAALLIPLILACSGARAQPSAPVRLAGTDFFKGAIADRIQSGSVPAGLSAVWPGTRRSLQMLKSGKCAIAIIACTSPDAIPEIQGMRKMPIAYRISRVIVAKDNPLEAINIEQLSAIFGSRAERKINLWNGLGLQGPWRARAIEPMVAERYTSYAREILEHHALQRDRLQAGVKVHADEDALATAFKQNPGAMAVFSSLHADRIGKPVAVALRAGESFGATPENLYFGDYPFQMPFVLLFPEGRTQELAPVIRLLYSPQVAQAIFEAGLAPVPDNFRAAELKTLGL